MKLKPIHIFRNQHKKLYAQYTDADDGSISMFRLTKRTVDLLLTNCIDLKFRDVTMLDFEDSKHFIEKCQNDFKHVRFDLKNNKVCCDNIE